MKIDLLAARPQFDMFTIPGDSDDNLMYRAGELMGISENNAVWRFGWDEESVYGKTGVHLTRGDDGNIAFIWVLSTRRAGVVKEVVRDWAVNLPQNFKDVIEAPVVVHDTGGFMSKPYVYSVRSHKVVVG